MRDYVLFELDAMAEEGQMHRAVPGGAHCHICAMNKPCDALLNGEVAAEAAAEIRSLRAKVQSC